MGLRVLPGRTYSDGGCRLKTNRTRGAADGDRGEIVLLRGRGARLDIGEHDHGEQLGLAIYLMINLR